MPTWFPTLKLNIARKSPLQVIFPNDQFRYFLIDNLIEKNNFWSQNAVPTQNVRDHSGLTKMVTIYFVGGLVVGFVIGWIILVYLTFVPIEKWKRELAEAQKTFPADREN